MKITTTRDSVGGISKEENTLIFRAGTTPSLLFFSNE